MCGRRWPVRSSITPPGVFSTQGSASHWSTVAAWARSACARRSTAATVRAEATAEAMLSFSHSALAWRQTRRARSKTRRVVSGRHTAPSHSIHFPHPATYRSVRPCSAVKRKARLSALYSAGMSTVEKPADPSSGMARPQTLLQQVVEVAAELIRLHDSDGAAFCPPAYCRDSRGASAGSVVVGGDHY